MGGANTHESRDNVSSSHTNNGERVAADSNSRGAAADPGLGPPARDHHQGHVLCTPPHDPAAVRARVAAGHEEQAQHHQGNKLYQ